MIVDLFKRVRDKTGPGLLFAASSIGVSHLVQSTRSGGTYALTFAAVIIGSCLIKYPVFRFGSDYASATGKTLVHGYRRQGQWAVAFFVIALLVDMFIATAAVALVTAGLFKTVMNIPANDITIALGLIVACAVLLITGRYRLFESLSKFFVVVMALLTILAAGMAVTKMNFLGGDYFPAVGTDRSSILFTIAVMGWMPTSVAASVFLSAWVCARVEVTKKPLTLVETRFDFNLGYYTTLALALCFLLLGTLLLYKSTVPIAHDAAGFGAQVVGLFTQVFGNWVFAGIAVVACIIMLSTLLTLQDGPPRTLASILRMNMIRRDLFVPLIIVQAAGTTAILVFFMKSFTAFVDFATSTAFLTAPVLAYLNHRCMMSEDVPDEFRPSRAMRIWSVAGIIFFTAFCGAFLYYRIWD